MRLAIPLCVATLLLVSCGTRDETAIDEARLAELRTMLDARRCGRNMDDLSFTIVYAVLGYDSAAVYAVPEGTPESLLVCPVSGLPYEVLVDSAGVSITCPSGHGTRAEEFR